MVRYTIEQFARHPAFDVSQHAIFAFKRDGYGNFLVVDANGCPLSEEERSRKLSLSESDGLAVLPCARFAEHQVESFSTYSPSPPPRLYSVRLDQSIVAIEEDGSFEVPDVGEPCPRLAPGQDVRYAGRVNFVIDREGWLIVGSRHHHILSGNDEVGGAGYLVFGDDGTVGEVNLNFSGHYRPPLSAGYVRYVYRGLRSHPLLLFAPRPEVNGRVFDEESQRTSRIRFTTAELESDDAALDELIERLLI
ncbi:hypothetical protein [Aquisphaera insulae]|uniref:hypothetical protein n=1 Tax=Aquisphaera insulae TaxID=2712864 RepID=UPI0013EDE646|nr:hypothetical protein [Aquisphaera insulae]